jgi:hypothetical protein
VLRGKSRGLRFGIKNTWYFVLVILIVLVYILVFVVVLVAY